MNIRTILGAALAAALCAPAAWAADPAPTKAVLTHETLWMMKRVGAPAVSPDGKWVIYSLTEPSYEADKAVSDLWLVPADGSQAPRRLTNTKAGEGDVAWSPDSRSIAFSTKREGDDAAQIYVLDLAGGGEARRVTSLSTGASHPLWRPDGQALLFETSVWPNAADDEANKKAAAERKALKYNVRAYEHYPVRYWNEWLDDRQPTLEVQSLEPGAKPHDLLSSTRRARTSGFFGQQNDSGVTLSPAWSPDGKEVVFIATTERWNAAFSDVGYRVWRMPADGGAEPAAITTAKGDYGDLSFSPDGKSLFFNFAPQDEEIYHLSRLHRMGWGAQTTAPALVTQDFDKEATRFAPSADGKTIYLLVAEAGKTGLYSVASSGGKPVRLIEPPTGGYAGLVVPQKSAKPELIATWASSVNPAEIVRIDPAAKTHANLTRVNTDLAATIDWAPPQHFWFTSSRGRPLHNMIVLPPHFDPSKKYPLLVFIHGGAASNNPDQISLRWNYHLLAAGGYVILMTDYTGSTSFGEKFAQAIKHDPLKGPGVEINEAVDEALKRYSFIDGSRMCAAGASYGGHLVNWLEGSTTRYRCMISHAGEADLSTQWGTSDGNYGREVTNGGPPWEGNPLGRAQSPITYGAQWKTPMLLSIGERDFRVPLNNTLESWAVLQRQKVPSRLLVWPDAWHWILKPEDSRHFYQEVDAWLARYLKDAPPPAKGG